MTRDPKVVVRVLCISSVVAAATPNAHALAQPKHYAISTGHCADQDLPPSFCNRLAVDDHNVDHEAWYELAAHAQTPEGASRCDAANMAVTFVHDRARRVRHGLRNLRAHMDNGREQEAVEATKDVAEALGQVLHAVQDNCAHSGMTNPQHAWLSLDDTCNNAGTDPDSRDEAIACAEDATRQLMTAFSQAVSAAGLTRRDLALYRKKAIFWPSRDEACEYYASADTWDGKDRRWNNKVMAGAMQAAVLDGFKTDNGAMLDVCSGDENALQPEVPQDVDTSGGQMMCRRVQALCAGSGKQVDAAAVSNLAPAQGCSGATPASADVVLLAWLGMVLTGFRRRR